MLRGFRRVVENRLGFFCGGGQKQDTESPEKTMVSYRLVSQKNKEQTERISLVRTHIDVGSWG